MADQSMKITNMPDSGSHQRVAFDLMKEIRYDDDNVTYKTKKELLTLYVDCLKATWGQVPD